MRPLRILADDLTGALDCAAAFGAGVAVHLGRPSDDHHHTVDIVATATRDVPVAELPALLKPSLDWLRSAGVAFKKIDSLLRGNTFDEIDWLARHAGFRGVALVPAFPAQRRITQHGRQWWQQPDDSVSPVAGSIVQSLQARGWRVCTDRHAPSPQDEAMAWVPDVLSDQDLDKVAVHALQTSDWLWCGSAGLAHALARALAHHRPARAHAATHAAAGGHLLMVSASHHAVTRQQWQVLCSSSLAAGCLRSGDLHWPTIGTDGEPVLIDLSSSDQLSAAQAAALLHEQTLTIARLAIRPRVLVVVGGDTLLALCRALGANSLISETAMDRPGWGCARLAGGIWDGLVCHTRSGAFGSENDFLEVISELQKNFRSS